MWSSLEKIPWSVTPDRPGTATTTTLPSALVPVSWSLQRSAGRGGASNQLRGFFGQSPTSSPNGVTALMGQTLSTRPGTTMSPLKRPPSSLADTVPTRARTMSRAAAGLMVPFAAKKEPTLGRRRAASRPGSDGPQHQSWGRMSRAPTPSSANVLQIQRPVELDRLCSMVQCSMVSRHGRRYWTHKSEGAQGCESDVPERPAGW